MHRRTVPSALALLVPLLACGSRSALFSLPDAGSALGDATSVDAALDSAVPESGTDSATPDGDVDAAPPDSGVDAAPPDSGAGDAESDADLYEEGGLACDFLTCNPAIAYCVLFTVAVGPPGGGMGYFCSALPAECLSNRTCSCLRANYDGGAGAVVEGCDGGEDAGITLSVEFP